MKNIVIVLLMSMFLLSSADGYCCDSRGLSTLSLGTIRSNDNMNLDIDDGTIILTSNGRDRETVKITEDYELYVNGKRIDLDEDQQELVRRCYDLTIDIIEYAVYIGMEGAKIGVGGAAIGLKAVTGVFKVLFTSYDSDEFEEYIEREADELEEMAEELEKKAEKLEDMADELDDVYYDMHRKIPEMPNWCQI